MERKVIKQGNNTLTITLPRSWTKKYDIKPKNNLNITIKDHILELHAKKIPHNIKTNFYFDLDDYNIIRWTLGALFRTGVDEICIAYKNKSIFNTIQKVIKKKFIGFIITEQGENRCVIKSISTDDENTLSSLIHRNFFIVVSFADNCFELFKNREFKKFKDILYLHDNSDQTTGLCQRIIIKNCYNDVINASFKVALLEDLELVCDVYQDICEICLELKKPFKNEKKIISLFAEANDFFRRISNLIFDFKKNEAAKLIESIQSCRKKIELLYSKADANEMIFLFHLQLILQDIRNFFPTMIILNTNEQRMDKTKQLK